MKPIIRLAVPIAGGCFSAHFGRADGFLLCDVEHGATGRTRTVIKRLKPGECERVPDWLKAMAVTTVLAGGAGAVARKRLGDLGIGLVTGLNGGDPAAVVADWLDRRQPGGNNPCRPQSHALRHCRPTPSEEGGPS